MAVIDGSHILGKIGGDGAGFKSVQRISVAAGAFGTVVGNVWGVNASVAIPAPVDAAYSVALCVPVGNYGPQARAHLMRCYVSSNSTVALLGSGFGGKTGQQSPTQPLEVWVYEFDPAAVKSVQKFFWQYNSISTFTLSPAIDINKILWFSQAGWYGNTTSATQEGTWGANTLTPTQFRPSREGADNVGIPHYVTTLVELV